MRVISHHIPHPRIIRNIYNIHTTSAIIQYNTIYVYNKIIRKIYIRVSFSIIQYTYHIRVSFGGGVREERVEAVGDGLVLISLLSSLSLSLLISLSLLVLIIMIIIISSSSSSLVCLCVHAISLTGKLIGSESGRVYSGRCWQPPRLAQISLVG